MAKLNYNNLFGKHKAEPAFVIGHGPSFNNVIDNIDKYKESGYVTFETNEWFDFHEKPPTYWVIANPIATIQRHFKKMNEVNTTVIYAYSADWTPQNFIDQFLKCDYMGYDERHLNGEDCGSGGCCRFRIPNTLTLAQEVMKYTKGNELYSKGSVGTSVVHALAIAIIMECSPIYITGVHLDYGLGYAGKRKLNIPPVIAMTPYIDQVINNFKILKESALNIGVEIFVIGDNPSFNVFENREIPKL